MPLYVSIIICQGRFRLLLREVPGSPLRPGVTGARRVSGSASNSVPPSMAARLRGVVPAKARGAAVLVAAALLATWRPLASLAAGGWAGVPVPRGVGRGVVRGDEDARAPGRAVGGSRPSVRARHRDRLLVLRPVRARSRARRAGDARGLPAAGWRREVRPRAPPASRSSPAIQRWRVSPSSGSASGRSRGRVPRAS